MVTEELPEPVDDGNVTDKPLPILATYAVNISFRGAEGTKAPTLAQVEEAIESILGSGGDVVVRASASRTD